MTDLVPTIVEFIRARLAEDEQTAKNCLDVNVRAAMIRGVEPPHWEYQDGQVRSASVPSAHITRTPILRVGHTWPAEGEHIARHDPLRVLRGVAWKRELLDEFEGAAETRQNYLNIDPTSSAARSASGMYYGLRHAVKLLGSEWAGHTDYREEEWRP